MHLLNHIIAMIDEKLTTNVFGIYELFLYGLLETRESSFGKKLLNWSMRLIVLINYTVWTYEGFVHHIIPNFTTHFNIMNFSLSVLYLFYIQTGFLFSISIWQRENEINRLMNEIIENSNSQTRKLLKRINLVVSVIHFLKGTILSCILILFQVHPGESMTSLIYKYYLYIVWAYFIFGMTDRAFFSYTYINYALSLTFDNESQQITNSNISRNNILKIHRLVKSRRRIRERINSLMGIFPLFNIIITFFFTILHITNYIVTRRKAGFDFEFWTWYFIDLSIHLLILVILGLFPTDNQLYLKVISWLTDIGNIDGNFHSQHKYDRVKCDLLNYLHALTNNPIQHNVCDLFLIDRKFLLNFIAILIPFSVMLIQMIQS
jgi:hypothetical protein